jgi:hypothetical protein
MAAQGTAARKLRQCSAGRCRSVPRDYNFLKQINFVLAGSFIGGLPAAVAKGRRPLARGRVRGPWPAVGRGLPDLRPFGAARPACGGPAGG